MPEISKTDAPQVVSDAARERMAAAEEAGFVHLGWLEVATPSPITVAGYATSDGEVMLAVLGQDGGSGFEPIAVDCVSRLDGGRWLTTTTHPMTFSQPERGIFKFSHDKLSAGELLARHREYVEGLDASVEGRVTTLDDLASAISDFLAYENQVDEPEESREPTADLSAATVAVAGPVREDGREVHLYNEGLLVLLYDAGAEQTIRDAEPEVIWGVGPETFDDEATRRLLDRGDLLVYGLAGDGEVGAEIVVGAEPTADEMAPALWLPPRTGWLRLPTGRLRIHTYNTLPMGDNGDEPDDPGGAVDVPPGDYRVVLHRKDWDGMRDARVADLEAALESGRRELEERIDEVIVLVPLARGDERPSGDNVLFREMVDV